MNCNLESGRVLAAVDDTYDELLFLSLLTSASSRASSAVSNFGSEDLRSFLRTYTEGDTHALPKATLRLCAWLGTQKDACAKLVAVTDDDTTCPEFAELVLSFGDARERLTSKLTKTAEHDARVAEAFEKGLDGETKLSEEKVALANQLALETTERERKMKLVNEHERKVSSLLAVIVGDARDEVRGFQNLTNANDDDQNGQFELQKEELTQGLTDLKQSLTKLREDHKTSETVLRKKVSDDEKKLKVKLEAYDGEVCSIAKDLEEAANAYETVSKSISDMQRDTETMCLEREREDGMQKKRQANALARREKILDKAAAVIQLAWKTHKENAARDKARGDEKGKKGKKGKKKG